MDVEVAVLVPVKGLDTAKQRLGPVLTQHERSRLARWMAEGVLAACHPLPVFVVCDDPLVAQWATDSKARVHLTSATDLNGAVADGAAAISTAGFDHVVVAHADLPLPKTLVDVARPSTITLVPDGARNGTNVASFPLMHRLPAMYGPGSFARHLDAALRIVNASSGHVGLEVRADPDLALDVDTVDDLRHPRLRKVLPSWLPTNQDNPSIR